MEQFYGRQKDFLKNIVEKDRLSHAYIFTGKQGVGKKDIALWWATVIDPCSDIATMQSREELILLKPNQKDIIGIFQIQEMRHKLSFTSVAGHYKVVIIDQAHRMNRYAQNALLKVLEEPLGQVVFILLTEQEGQLLDTVVSRCQILHFSPVKEDEIEEFFEEKVDADALDKITFLSDGCPQQAFQLAQDAEKLDEEFKKVEEAVALLDASLNDRFQWVKEKTKLAKEGKIDLNHYLTHLRNYFHRLLLAKAEVDFTKSWFNSGNSYTWEQLVNILERIQSISSLINNTNVNKKIALEQLMLTF